MKYTHIYLLLLLHLTSSASQPDFSLVPYAEMHPLTNADFILLTLSLRTKFGVAQRTYFEKQPDEFLKTKLISIPKSDPKPVDELFYPLKANITDLFYKQKNIAEK